MSPEPQADERTTRCFISFSFKSCEQEQSPKQAEVDRQAGRLTEADFSKKKLQANSGVKDRQRSITGKLPKRRDFDFLTGQGQTRTSADDRTTQANSDCQSSS